MADIYLNSRNSAPGRDGLSPATAFNSFAELASAYTLAGGNNYKLARGSYWNTSACILLPSLTTLPITFSAYGPETDPLPVIECFRMAARSECNTEVAITHRGATSSAVGATTDSGAGYSIGATVITLASAGTGALTAGGRVSFANDPNIYELAVGDSNVTNGGTITLVAPGLLVAIPPATATAITPRDNSGTAVGATTDAAGYAIGATVITLASAGTGTLFAGGGVTFNGDTNVYSLASGDEDVSNGGTITLNAPGLLQAIPPSATAITRVTGTITKAQAGTNLWRVPARFFGLYGDDVWGAQCDITNSVGLGSTPPAASRENSYQRTDGGLYRLVYSVGNPFDAFGGLYLTNVSDADYAAGTYRQSIIGIFQGAGGVVIEGIEFGRGFNSIRIANGNGSAANPLFKEFRVKNCVFHNNLCGPYFVSTNNENLGYAKVRVTDNYFKNIGNSCIWMSGGVMNDTLNERNVMNGWGYAFSTGCIYIGGGVHTTDGSRITTRFNSISGGVSGRVYTADGYSLYQEAGDFTGPMYRPTCDVEFSWNFLWNNDLSCISNKPGKNILWRGNVAYCKPGVAPAHWGKFLNCTFGTQYGGTVASDVTVVDNIGIGYLRFMFNGAGLAAKWTVKGNVCTSRGDQGGYSSDAISWTDADYTRLILDGNNFIGFTRMWYDGAVNRTAPPYVLNAITSDPSAELARLPVPTNPKVNYALMLGPGPAIKAGVVDLRYGSRLAS